MPHMCGQETLDQIRSTENQNKTTPVLAVTADAMVGDREKYLERGFDAYLSKPVDAVQLRNAMESFVSLVSNRQSKVAV